MLCGNCGHETYSEGTAVVYYCERCGSEFPRIEEKRTPDNHLVPIWVDKNWTPDEVLEHISKIQRGDAIVVEHKKEREGLTIVHRLAPYRMC